MEFAQEVQHLVHGIEKITKGMAHHRHGKDKENVHGKENRLNNSIFKGGVVEGLHGGKGELNEGNIGKGIGMRRNMHHKMKGIGLELIFAIIYLFIYFFK